ARARCRRGCRAHVPARAPWDRRSGLMPGQTAPGCVPCQFPPILKPVHIMVMDLRDPTSPAPPCQTATPYAEPSPSTSVEPSGHASALEITTTHVPSRHAPRPRAHPPAMTADVPKPSDIISSTAFLGLDCGLPVATAGRKTSTSSCVAGFRFPRSGKSLGYMSELMFG